jgi:undecaprenyl diphosphate synthase
MCPFCFDKELRMAEVPQHIAIILDGNGRWAKAKGMPRTYGHTMGAKNVEPICRAADALGVKYLTMYAFSTENWNRPSDEVAALMKLLESYEELLEPG